MTEAGTPPGLIVAASRLLIPNAKPETAAQTAVAADNSNDEVRLAA